MNLYFPISHVNFETLVGFTQKKFNIPNEWSKKKFQESNIWSSFVQNTKRTCLFTFFNAYNL